MIIDSLQLNSIQLTPKTAKRPLKVTGWGIPLQQQQNRPGGNHVDLGAAVGFQN